MSCGVTRLRWGHSVVVGERDLAVFPYLQSELILTFVEDDFGRRLQKKNE
jgi:hypothetical protein